MIILMSLVLMLHRAIKQIFSLQARNMCIA